MSKNQPPPTYEEVERMILLQHRNYVAATSTVPPLDCPTNEEVRAASNVPREILRSDADGCSKAMLLITAILLLVLIYLAWYGTSGVPPRA